ncbi:GGDEF domain-containing protein [Halomonas daqingensis]|uniref:diguanylate cyclase n=1 Tax=Billgrantia desiderata TaxID=52021 RepID=A0AAW4YVF0_9GAMM|nr:biofilm regulation diguanylate cyclase SiaD [Halomonas desiderata]MCE8052408.1 GGDEF domain-containing protein [Halomonas desiderata]
MTREETELMAQVDALLDDPAHADNPLRPALARLHAFHRAEKQRLERLVTIADGYQRYVREDERKAQHRYQKSLRRQEKLSRISDGYQQLMHERNSALREASTHDPLTGLPNRRLIDERLPKLDERKRYTLVMLDIDHFKHINDRHGHEAGDQVLVSIAQTIRQELRDYDLCARWGGEEFLLLLADTGLSEASTIVDRLRQRLAEQAVQVGDSRLSITASAGLSEYRDGEDLLNHTLLRADQALLQAKRSGRDRSCVAD